MTALDTRHVVHAQLEVQGCTAELYLNGVPLTRLGPRTAALASVAAQQYLIDGTNRLEVLVEPGPSPGRARTEARDLSLVGAVATGRLLRLPDGAAVDVGLGTTLAEVTFRSADLTTRVATYPRSLTADADLGVVAGRWGFQDAPALVLDEALIDEARAVLDELGAALRNGSAQALLALLDDQRREILRAYPVMTEAYLRDDLTAFVGHFQRSAAPVLPLAPERHDFRLVAGGHMLECVDADWQPSLRLLDPDRGEPAPYPVFLARLGKALRVVR